MIKNLSILYLSLFLLFCISCNREFRESISTRKTPLQVYVSPTTVDIEIYFLKSISSQDTSSEKRKELIRKISKEHGQWFQARLEKTLQEEHIKVVPVDNADLILDTKILDMGEIRARKFIEGLSVGLVLGAIIGEATGDSKIGLAVFVWEVIEEIMIVYLLKTFLMITTIELTILEPDKTIVLKKEFTSYSNRDYEKTVAENLRDLRETRVQGSLDQNVKDIVEFLKK